MNTSIFKAMQKDLNLSQYSGESMLSFEKRLLYCACAQWMRFFVLDQNERGESYPKSKKYLLRRGRETIPYMIKAFPESADWFTSEDDEWPFMNFIRDIRESMVATGELLIDEKGGVCLPSYTNRALIGNVDRILGVNNSKMEGEIYVGITRIIKTGFDDREPYRLRIDSRVFADELFSRSTFSTCHDMDRYEFFNPYSRKALYQSWDNKPNNNIRIAFARMQVINGMQEYYLFRKKSDGKCENARLQDYYKEQGEYRRIMLALRAEAGNHMKAFFKDCGEAILLKLFCYLPRVQDMQLRTFCWPRESYDDRLNYIVPKWIWSMLTEMFKDLHIELQEDRNL